MNTILITGSEGNIGTFLVEYIKKTRPDFKIIRVGFGQGENKKDNFYQGDLADSSFAQKIFQENSVDYVIHLAARSYNINDLKNNVYDIYSNDTKSLLNILDNSKSIKKFIYFSSAIIYESLKESILMESPVSQISPPKSSLGLAKYSGEKAVEFLYQQYGVPYTIWRPFNVVSPLESHEREGAHVFVDFYRKIFIEKSPRLQVHGSGKQVKCFIWVEDLVSAIGDFLKDTKTDNQIFNIAGKEQKTLIDLAKTLITIGKEKNFLLQDYNLEITTENEFSQDEVQKIPSTENIRKVLGWEAKTSFKSCFEKFIEYKQKV